MSKNNSKKKKNIKSTKKLDCTQTDKYSSGWNVGFAIMTFIVLAILIYTLSIRDMTPYQLAILLISLYTMGTMAICLPFKFKEGEQTKPTEEAKKEETQNKEEEKPKEEAQPQKQEEPAKEEVKEEPPKEQEKKEELQKPEKTKA